MTILRTSSVKKSIKKFKTNLKLTKSRKTSYLIHFYSKTKLILLHLLRVLFANVL